MKISSIFDRVNIQLSNSGYVTWPEVLLRSFYEEAVSVVLTALPVGYVESRDLPLVQGTHQVLADDIRGMLSAIGNVNAANEFTTPVAETGDMGLFRDEQAALSGMVPGETSYEALRVYVDPLDPLAFYVLPSVPTGYAGKLRARVVAIPTAPNWAEVGGPDFPLRSAFDVAIIEHMLYRAFGRSDETNPDYQRSIAHLQARDAEMQRLGTMLGIPIGNLQMAETARQ